MKLATLDSLAAALLSVGSPCSGGADEVSNRRAVEARILMRANRPARIRRRPVLDLPGAALASKVPPVPLVVEHETADCSQRQRSPEPLSENRRYPYDSGYA